MEAAHGAPGRMSRGAIQHRTPRSSSTRQTASATALSLVEWLMNASHRPVSGRAAGRATAGPVAMGGPGGATRATGSGAGATGWVAGGGLGGAAAVAAAA